MDDYDSREDTLKHIERVRQLIYAVRLTLELRGDEHDASKLAPPEKEAFDRCTPNLKKTTYGTPEYKAACRELGPALKHHHENNPHHPEYYGEGIAGMSLVDLMEMLCDWKAAGERHADGGDLRKSLEHNRERFGMGDQLYKILCATVEQIGW